ncbi:sulfite reductase [Blattabacterium sp. (Mastotermes darwiniensis) str. MADAR]|uniref:diflavin oxidoreductase n=1 Tax=Blattabacterium sp. (Mastotermes darwiniensis) TaxID=39768 RepID=UPI000231DE49|nr:flavodoxin domain-containing protein [Blattabacterium sp. (Mastotermes darwiniensis)]AER40637.1 sulfite reductase [Blattabacterium sp. (Mastotermes darwiniensis) str. MADAR]
MLSESKNKIFIELIKNISREELIWIYGYISGILSSFHEEEKTKVLRKEVERITLVYGTETGNAKNLSFSIVEKMKKENFKINLISLDQYRFLDLKRENYFFVIISTHGEGEPPSSAKSFFNFIHKNLNFRLENMKYGVLALGDRSYPFFCKAGEDLDKRLYEMGACRVIPLYKCDIDFEFKAKDWLSEVLNILKKKKVDRKKKIHGKILTNILLNDQERGSNKEIHHIEILMENGMEKFDYLPGDSIAVIAKNPVDEVQNIIDFFKKKDLFENSKERKKVRLLLEEEWNIFRLSINMLRKYSLLVGKKIPNDRMWNFFDLLNKFPIKKKKFLKNLIEIMDPIRPRFYSISSSPKVHYPEIHITVSRHRFKVNGENRYGYCSNYLSKLKEGDSLSFYIHKNYLFKLPKNNKDIILIGPGTGIAPFRSFLYEREFVGATGRNWLFFGDQHFSTDFLYQTEIQNWKKNGVLYRVSLAFSRDQEKKIYIQDKIWENREEFFTWIGKKGAYIYICGNKKPMSIDVEKTIFRIIEQVGGYNFPEFFIKKMKEEGRYLKDVY